MAEVPENPAGMFPQAKPEDRYTGQVVPPTTQEQDAQRREEERKRQEQQEYDANKTRVSGGLAFESNPPHPAGSPPPATEPAVADPNAVPSNVRQREEVRRKEDEEFARKHAGAAPGLRDPQYQQPGAPAQQYERALERNPPMMSEKTQAEMEAGRKRVATVEEASRNRDEMKRNQEEQEKRELEQLAGATSETGEQLEAKRKEAQRQQETWGAPPADVNRNTIAGTKEE